MKGEDDKDEKDDKEEEKKDDNSKNEDGSEIICPVASPAAAPSTSSPNTVPNDVTTSAPNTTTDANNNEYKPRRGPCHKLVHSKKCKVVNCPFDHDPERIKVERGKWLKLEKQGKIGFYGEGLL